MPTFAIVNQIDLYRIRMNRDDGYMAHVKERMRREMAREVFEKIPPDQPTMVLIQEHEVENYLLRSLEVGYRVHLEACRHMDITTYMPQPPIRVPPIYVDRPVVQAVEKIVERIVPPPPPPPDTRTPWEKFQAFLDYIAPEVQYDGGYGEPE